MLHTNMSNRAAFLNNPVVSLSGQLRQDAKKDRETKKLASLNRQSASSPPRSMHASHSSLPTISSKKSTFADTLSLYRSADPFGRLSGLVENVNSSGLFADRVSPMKPLAMCVKCGTHASLCMSCSEEDCERTVTFYRKTRAAGAAALFTKAFVEAGNTQVIKFITFRIMKNSFLTRKREQLKKRSVVEKLFGTNLVYLPFTAWRRYTKENIVKRKDKNIAKLADVVKHLEKMVNENNANVEGRDNEIARLRKENAEFREKINQRDERIADLEDRLQKEQARVLGLSALAVPIDAYGTAINRLLNQKLIETNHYLHVAATTSVGYDYSNIFQPSVLNDIGIITAEKASAAVATKQMAKAAATKSQNASNQVLLDWVNHMSQIADAHVEPNSGKLLSHFLPPHVPAESFSELRTGKLLTRVVLCVLFDRLHLRNTMQSHIGTNDQGEPLLTKSWMDPAVTLEDLQEIKPLEAKPMELITFLMRIAGHALDLPAYKPMDIFAGKASTMQSIVVALMNASVPTVDRRAKDAIEKCISSYYYIAEEVEGLAEAQTAAKKIASISSFYDPKAVEGEISDAEYNSLCEVLDDFLNAKEYLKSISLSKRVLGISSKLSDLQDAVFARRDEHEKGVIMTTELRQFVVNNFISATVVLM